MPPFFPFCCCKRRKQDYSIDECLPTTCDDALDSQSSGMHTHRAQSTEKGTVDIVVFSPPLVQEFATVHVNLLTHAGMGAFVDAVIEKCDKQWPLDVMNIIHGSHIYYVAIAPSSIGRSRKFTAHCLSREHVPLLMSRKGLLAFASDAEECCKWLQKNSS